MAKSKAKPKIPPIDVLFRWGKENVSSVPYSYKLRLWAEREMGLKLPQAYIDLLKKQNGGTLRLSSVYAEEKLKGGKISRFVVDVYNLPGIKPDSSSSLPELIEMQEGWDMPKGLLPLSGDGHTWICLDYRKCGPQGEPTVVYVDNEDNDFISGEDPATTDYTDVCLVGKNFEDFLSKLFFTSDSLLIAIDSPRFSLAKVDQPLQTLGCKSHLNGDHSWWEWKSYEDYSRLCSSTNRAGKAGINFRRNGDKKDPWTLDRPGHHPLLEINISVKHQQEASEKLVEVFSDEISFIHVPPDRPKLKKIKVETSNSLDISKTKK
ncbi:MAG: SMI1/KNR4 family protein [Planctomycetaceae bacterium]